MIGRVVREAWSADSVDPKTVQRLEGSIMDYASPTPSLVIHRAAGVSAGVEGVEVPGEDVPEDEWDESVSPFRKVASIDIPPQSFESPERMEFCENLAFNPWQSLAEHRPLGGLNRARKDLYRELAEFRHQWNEVSYTEPTGEETF